MSRLAPVVAVSLLVAFGCGQVAGPPVPQESITGSGQNTTIDRDGEFDLSITGYNNVVTVAGGTARNLTITGNGNRLVFRYDTNLLNVTITGHSNRIELPAGVEPASVAKTGSGNDVGRGGAKD